MLSQQDSAPLRVDSLSVSKCPEVRKARCASWEDCSPLGAGGLSPLSCLGTVEPPQLAGLALLSDLRSLTGFLCHVDKFIGAWYALCPVQLPDKPTQLIGKSFKIWKQTEFGGKSTLCRFCVRNKFGLQAFVPFKKKKSFLPLKSLGFPPAMYHIKVAGFCFLSRSLAWFGLSHILFNHS